MVYTEAMHVSPTRFFVVIPSVLCALALAPCAALAASYTDVDSANYLYDVDVSGTIDASDLAALKARAGLSIP